MDATNDRALDVIAAFAVPSPGFQRLESGFFAFGRLRRSPFETNHPAYFGLALRMAALSAIDRFIQLPRGIERRDFTHSDR